MNRKLAYVFFAFIVLITVIISGCTTQAEITNFDECIAAGYPAMESYPRQCAVPGGQTFVEVIGGALNLEEARAIAENSSCAEEGNLKDTYTYNPDTKTWWLDLNASLPDCPNPACVVSEETLIAEINWRCTGAQ